MLHLLQILKTEQMGWQYLGLHATFRILSYGKRGRDNKQKREYREGDKEEDAEGK